MGRQKPKVKRDYFPCQQDLSGKARDRTQISDSWALSSNLSFPLPSITAYYLFIFTFHLSISIILIGSMFILSGQLSEFSQTGHIGITHTQTKK